MEDFQVRDGWRSVQDESRFQAQAPIEKSRFQAGRSAVTNTHPSRVVVAVGE